MSARTAAPTPARPAAARSRARARTSARLRRTLLRRRLLMLVATGVVAALGFSALSGLLPHAVQELALPLRHEDVIRQQATDKGLDPALIAGVIYTESRFRDQTSPAGAKGLMQLLPSTADYIARKSGGTAFVQGDLATPQVNIAYGSWYLRYLLRRYHGNELLAIAAYNAGEGRIDRWVADAAARGEDFDAASHIPFQETRDYVQRVTEAEELYRKRYPAELGLR